MESELLYRIDPPSKDRSPLQVGNEILSLIKKDFSYTTSSLCKLLLCDRQWVDLTFRPTIRHIVITHYFRDYILKNVPMDAADKTLLSQGFIFYSASDIHQYWKKHAIAECKTKMIDLGKYQKGGFTYDLQQEMEYHQSVKPNKKEKERHMSKMEKLLTEEGFYLYQLSYTTPKEWTSCPLPSLSPALPLTNLAETRALFFLNSNASAMQHLIKKGGIRIKLGARALWVLPNISSCRVPIAIPADIPPQCL